ncbi:MAG: hypothetical protein HFE82_07200 [Erysipelotrichaceae bacterium]|nr:hypothetical protein [Erysipelotrichaceae bacterium]
MWKKLITGLIALTMVLSVGYIGYAMNYKMDASGSGIGGTVYGKIGSLSEGDRIYLGTKNLEGENVGWVLLDKLPNNNSWRANSTKLISNVPELFFIDGVDASGNITIKPQDHTIDQTNQARVLDEFNARLAGNSHDMEIVAKRSTEFYESLMNDPTVNNYFYINTKFNIDTVRSKNSFPSAWTKYTFGTLANRNKAYGTYIVQMMKATYEYGVSVTETNAGDHVVVEAEGSKVAYPITYAAQDEVITLGGAAYYGDASISSRVSLEPESVCMGELFSGFITDGNQPEYATTRHMAWFGKTPNYVTAFYWNPASGGFSVEQVATKKAGTRASIEFDQDKLNDVVFALSQPTVQGSGSVDIDTPKTTYGTYESKENLKLRISKDTMHVSFEDIKYNDESIYTKQNLPKSAFAKVEKDETIKLSVDGNSGGDSYGANTISALIFNSSGKFIKYSPLSPTTDGLHDYELNLKKLGLAKGKYTIKVVNEQYNEDLNETTPVYCSQLSDPLSIEVVDPLTISYDASSTVYTYKDNVNLGDIVGTLSFKDGISPYHVEFDTTNGEDYKNFSFSKESDITGSSISIKVNQDAPSSSNNSLNVGTYEFCMIGYDVYDKPEKPELGKSKVCTTLIVEKANTQIAFNQPNQTKKTAAEAGTNWNETATARPTEGTKIKYSISGGDIGLIDIDEDSGEITYKGNGTYGKVKIKATVDDDPETGNDNYNEASTEKEIVIVREVDGVVTPDKASSDINTPTYAMDQANIKIGGVIGKIEGRNGTPDNLENGDTKITYSYAMKSGGNASFFEVNSTTGEIKTKANLAVGTYKFKITVSDKWSSKDIEVTVNVGMAAAEELKFYENSSSNTVITTKSVKVTDTNVTVYATVKGSTNNNPVTYKIKDGSTNVIEVNPNSGAITIHGVGTVTIVAEKKGASGQADASAELTFTVTAGAQEFIYTDEAGNELPKQADKYKAYEEVYEKDKTFQLYTAGNPTGSNVTYRLKSGSPTDVISVDSNGLVHILNASLNTQMGKVIVEATSHDPSGNYADKTIELPINIKKADQTISFADVTYVTSGQGKVTPVINEQDLSSNDGGVQVNDTDYYITVDSSVNTSIAWTNDGIEIEYDYDGEEGMDIPLHVEKQGNRNYNKAEADGILHIMGPDENMLAVSSPGKIIYGDHFAIRSLQDDSSSTNVQYTFEVDNTTYISNPTVNGNKAEFNALKYSGTTTIKIKVIRTADGETPLSKTITVQVLPKPIEIVIDDKEKLKGEPNPTLTYQDFKKQLVTWSGVQDVIQTSDIKLSTTAKTDSNAGTYPIKGDSNTLNKTYPNYSFSFKEGTLTIKEEAIEDDWYHLEINDGNNTIYTGGWTNQDVNIISDHNEYINMSLDQSTWKPNQVTVTKEGETNQSFWMKKDSGATTKEKQEIIRIDRTAPKVKGIKAKDTNNTLQNIINKLTGGIFFKPGTAFEITTSDAKDDLKVSGTREIAYKVYKITDETEEQIKEGTLTVTNEKAKITISETVGKYKVCVIPTDNAGNTNTESCHEVALKKIDVDEDGDGIPDFNDPDGDGCPDLNIKWKDPNDESKWIVINGDRNNDGIPDLNIDSDGDGIPDLNIDTDKDGKPDLNLVILKKSDWKATKCVQIDIDNGILEEYCTGTSVKAAINVDTDNDGIPNINIDNKGDFKPHINIAKDGKNPSVNIVEIHEWKPKKDYKSGKFTYDSIGKNDIKPEINIDSDGDGFPDINIDLDDDGEPDINIDVDGDGIPDIDIDSTGDGIPDVNVDNDGDGKPDENIIEIIEWKPGKNVEGDLPYDTMDFSEPDEPKDDNDTSVKGQYNPATSMGGASTGDSTNIMIYMGISLLSISLLLYLSYKYKTE